MRTGWPSSDVGSSTTCARHVDRLRRVLCRVVVWFGPGGQDVELGPCWGVRGISPCRMCEGLAFPRPPGAPGLWSLKGLLHGVDQGEVAQGREHPMAAVQDALLQFVQFIAGDLVAVGRPRAATARDPSERDPPNIELTWTWAMPDWGQHNRRIRAALSRPAHPGLRPTASGREGLHARSRRRTRLAGLVRRQSRQATRRSRPLPTGRAGRAGPTPRCGPHSHRSRRDPGG